MNRKLHNTILAFSVSGVMLAAGLLVAHPVGPDPAGPARHAAADATVPAPLAPVTVAVAIAPRLEASRAAEDALAARIEARGRRFEAEVARAESLEHALAATAGFVATFATEAAAAGALGELGIDVADRIEEAEEKRDARSKPRNGNVRSAIAVPYFSFARGTGRGDRS